MAAASVAEMSFSPMNPRFFSIVLDQTLRNNRLIIPERVVKKCGESLSDDVLLKLPCGSEWELGLTRSAEGRVWIHKGWLQFSNHYSIAKGHLLVLSYEGNSQFKVVIFDTSTTEIDYPVKKRAVKQTQNHENPVKEEEEEIEISGNKDDASEEMRNGKSAPTSSCTSRLSSRKAKQQALARANGFKSEHPYFKVVIQPSSVRKGKSSLNVPRDFYKLHLCMSKKVVLRNPAGRSWPINYRICTDHRGRFDDGWSKFAQENDLKKGDVCVFVMVKSIRTIMFEVSFFRDNGISYSGLVPGQPTRDRINHQSKNPFFSVYMHASKVYQLKIPADFFRNYATKHWNEIRLCVSDGRSWSVRCKINDGSTSRRVSYFGKGWTAFIRGSGLKEGDICTFELTNKIDISFDVRIVKVLIKNMSKCIKHLGRTEPNHCRGIKR